MNGGWDYVRLLAISPNKIYKVGSLSCVCCFLNNYYSRKDHKPYTVMALNNYKWDYNDI